MRIEEAKKKIQILSNKNRGKKTEKSMNDSASLSVSEIEAALS